MTLRVATYNVHRCVGRDGICDPNRVARVVGDLDAGLIGLQEVESGGRPFRSQLEVIAASTGMIAVPGAAWADIRGDYGNAILTRFPLLDQWTIDLSVTGREPRRAVVADLDCGGTVVSFATTHLGLRARERARQLDLLLEALLRCESEVVILTGDLNEWLPQSPRLRRLHRVFDGSRSPRSFPAGLPILALDRILVRGGSVRGLSTVRTNEALVASDHRPVVGEVGWERPRRSRT